jgi:uncharacterized Zn finger protein
MAALRSATDAGRFARGAQYADRVRSISVRGSRATAIVDLNDLYEVALDWSGGALNGSCTCPDYAEGGFCKHLVGLGLALLDRARLVGPPADAGGSIEGYLGQLDREELMALVGRLTERDAGALDLIRADAVAAGRHEAIDADALARRVTATLTTRDFVHYRESYGVARDADDLLDHLEELLEAGAADAVAKALLRATSRLRRILQHADDSSGVIGAAGQRAVELYARACREGNPNRMSLAKWLVKFRRESPGWPEVHLAMFVAAFDDAALAAYRREVERWSDELSAGSRSERFEVNRALLELADHDGDIDRSIGLLSTDPEYTAYGAIIDRLLAGDRRSEAVDWLDQAIAARRLSVIAYGARNDYWISPSRAVELYVAAGRPEDALSVLQRAYAQQPRPDTWRELLGFAASLGRTEEMRRWAVESAEKQASGPHGSGADLITIYLAEGMLEEAWDVQRRFSAGAAWKALADASAASRPAEAARLYPPQIEVRLVRPNTSVYPEVARLLVDLRRLHEAAGDTTAFREYVAQLRTAYARRPSLMKALAAHGI